MQKFGKSKSITFIALTAIIFFLFEGNKFEAINLRAIKRLSVGGGASGASDTEAISTDFSQKIRIFKHTLV